MTNETQNQADQNTNERTSKKPVGYAVIPVKMEGKEKWIQVGAVWPVRDSEDGNEMVVIDSVPAQWLRSFPDEVRILIRRDNS